MADIEITCQKCGTVITLSEFADTGSIACRKCGEKLQKEEVAVPRPRPSVKILTREQTEAAGKEDEAPPTEWRFHKHTQKEEIKGQSALFTAHHIGSWVVFLVLGGLMGWLRYGHVLEPQYMQWLKDASPVVLLILHIVIILAAFKQSVFQGVLGVLIPPYPYYFLFAASDAFFLRAFVAGLLVGIGQDAFSFVGYYTKFIYDLVTGYIAKGG